MIFIVILLLNKINVFAYNSYYMYTHCCFDILQAGMLKMSLYFKYMYTFSLLGNHRFQSGGIANIDVWLLEILYMIDMSLKCVL